MEKVKDHMCKDCGRFVGWGNDFLDEFQRCRDCMVLCRGCVMPVEAVDSMGYCLEHCSEEMPCSKCGRITVGWDVPPHDDGVDEFGRCTDCSVYCECCGRDVEALSDVVPDECPFCARITKELEGLLPERLLPEGLLPEEPVEGCLEVVFCLPHGVRYGCVLLQYRNDSPVGDFLDDIRIVMSVADPQEATEPFMKKLEEQLMSLVAKHTRPPVAELRACSMMQLCDAVKVENKDAQYPYQRGRQEFTHFTLEFPCLNEYP